MTANLRKTKALLGGGLFLTLLLSQLWLGEQLRLAGIAWVTPAAEADLNRKRLDPGIFRMISFGELPVMIDWVWIKCLIDPVMTHVPKGVHPPLFYHFDLLTRLDPLFMDAYLAGGNLLAIVRKDGEGAIELVERANRFRKETLPSLSEEFRNRYWPRSWMVPILLGYLQLFERQDIPSASRAFLDAAEIPGAPPYLLRLRERLQKPNGQYEVGLRLLSLMIASASHDRLKTELERKFASLEISNFLLELNLRFDSYRSQKRLQRLPLSDVFELFLKESRQPPRDPREGRLFLDARGKITSSTPREAVFGLE